MSDSGASWRISSLWCYPVKSMQGEERDELIFGSDGVEGDRQYGVLDAKTNTVARSPAPDTAYANCTP